MKLRTLDIFSGCGGSSAGAARAGATIVAGIDAWAVATESFKANFPNAHVITEKLEGLDVKALHKKIGDIELLLASPECTNHTLAKGGARRSEISRKTALQVLRFAQEFKPRWIVMENVTRMRKWRRYKFLINQLKKECYEISEQVLNSQDFGVAQDRNRLFVLCDRLRTPPVIKPSARIKRKTVRDILDPTGTWPTSELLQEGRAISTIARYCNGLEKQGERRSFLLVYYGTDAGGGWQALDRPLRTVTTLDRFALITPNGGKPRIRMLQVPELKRAMGFSDRHILASENRRDQIKLLGNAVCPPVMRAVVRQLTNAKVK